MARLTELWLMARDAERDLPALAVALIDARTVADRGSADG